MSSEQILKLLKKKIEKAVVNYGKEPSIEVKILTELYCEISEKYIKEIKEKEFPF